MKTVARAENLFGLSTEDLSHVLRHGENDLAMLRQARVFLTGGTGFFGKWLLAALVHADEELELELRLTVLSRNPSLFLQRHPDVAACTQITFQPGDVATLEPGKDSYDFIIHAATDTTGMVTSEQEAERERTIVEGTRRVLDRAGKSGTRRTLLVSSGGVYGAASGQVSGAREDDPIKPLTAYGRAKRVAEKLGEESPSPVVIARAFAFLGPLLPLDAHYAAGNFLRDAHRGGPIRVQGDGTAQRSYLYPADLVIWLLRLLQKGERGRAYNVGSQEKVTTAQLAHTISAGCPSSPEVIIEKKEAAGTADIYLPDISRARGELGLDVWIPLEESIERTLQFLNRSL